MITPIFSRIRHWRVFVAHPAMAAAVFLGASVPCSAAKPSAPTIHLIGDSTMADKPRADLPERGWGQLFPEVVIAPAKVDNQARNGRSTRSFIAERRWQQVVASLKPGDWVIIQFGHNDQKADNPKVFAAADTDFRANLRKFVAETRAKSAHPVIATPVVRRRWTADGKFADTLGAYPAAARAVAEETGTPLLDLHDLTLKMESEAGVEGSKRFHFSGDDTHYSETGAREVASLAAAEVHRQKLPLARWLALPVTACGAVGDGRMVNTKSIQSAIDRCPDGGVVRIPAGVFLSGALFLKSDMTLEIAKDGVLKGSASPDDYLPLVRNRFEGWEMETYASLVNAGRLDAGGQPNIHDLSIRGEGRISGGGKELANRMIAAKGLRGRGRLVCLMNAEQVDITGLTLDESPCWTLHYIYSRHVNCRGLTIRSNVRNGDGIDPDSSSDSLITDCVFDTGDDCIAIKSGKNPEGNRINRPTERIRISGCRFLRGHGISIGSEMSGGVRDVVIEKCVAGPLLHGLQIKGTNDRGGVVENLTVRDCELRKISILTNLNYNNDGAPAPDQPVFRNFRFSNLDLTKADPSKPLIIVNGFPAEGHRTRQVAFENLSLPGKAIIEVDQAEDVSFSHIITSGARPVWKITRSERVTGVGR
ncbi:MAG: hypothetical protein J0M04_20350 [Verrucomicrobia bacterium]|nr:hypothetical protein [Verrucomicrobiota bacterium]